MEDLIRRQDALKAINEVDCYGDGIGFEVLSHAHRDVALLPLVEAEPVRHGHWTPTYVQWGEFDISIDAYECSVCKAVDYDADNYCPNCGAKMGEGKEE